MLADTRDLGVESPGGAPSTSIERVHRMTEQQQSMAAAIDTGPKSIELGGTRYPCCQQIPALNLADFLDRGATLKAGTESDSPGEKIRTAISILDYFVLDEHLPEIKARMTDKSDPIGFPETMEEINRLMPGYTGSSLGKASSSSPGPRETGSLSNTDSPNSESLNP